MRARRELNVEREPRARAARHQRALAHAAQVDLARHERGERVSRGAQRGRPQRQRRHGGGGPLAAGDVGRALEGQPDAVVARVQQRGRDGDVVALALAIDIERGQRLLVDEQRHALLRGQRAHRDRQRRVRDGGVAVDREERHRRQPRDQRGGVAFVLRAEQPGRLPAAVDVLEKVEAAGVDDQAAVAGEAGVHPVGVEIDRGAESGRVDGRGRGRGRGGGGRGGGGRGGGGRHGAVDAGRLFGRRPAARDQERERRGEAGRAPEQGMSTRRATRQAPQVSRRVARRQVRLRRRARRTASPHSSTSVLAEAPGATLQAQPPGWTASLWAVTA